ncbi:MAG TPA: hypothetical protein VGI65_12745 [Steroidobacteraceae bacterium]|jgi:hypothetical protein
MRAYFVALTILASSAHAAEFRGSELDRVCTSIPEREHALESQVVLSAFNQYRFTGRAFDREVVMLYLCPGGVLSSGNYLFANHFYNDVVSDFRAAYVGLSSIYGAPFSGGALPSQGMNDKSFPRIGNEPKTYIASWKGPDFFASMALSSQGDAAGLTWHVIFMIKPSNKSSERSN